MINTIIVTIAISFSASFFAAWLGVRLAKWQMWKIAKANRDAKKDNEILRMHNSKMVDYINYVYSSTNELIRYINKRDGTDFVEVERYPYLGVENED